MNSLKTTAHELLDASNLAQGIRREYLFKIEGCDTERCLNEIICYLMNFQNKL